MRSKLINQENGLRTFVLLLEEGNEVVASLINFAKVKNLGSSRFDGTGGLEDPTLGYPYSGFRRFKKNAIQQPLEALCFSGEIRLENMQPEVRIRAVLGNSEGMVYGGYLLKARVRAAFEMIITELPKYLQYRSPTPTKTLTLEREKQNDLQAKIF